MWRPGGSEGPKGHGRGRAMGAGGPWVGRVLASRAGRGSAVARAVRVLASRAGRGSAVARVPAGEVVPSHQEGKSDHTPHGADRLPRWWAYPAGVSGGPSRSGRFCPGVGTGLTTAKWRVH